VAALPDGPKARAGLTGVLPVAALWLAILALLAFAASFVGFLYRTSRHRSSFPDEWLPVEVAAVVSEVLSVMG
jgi:hypothetical protein